MKRDDYKKRASRKCKYIDVIDLLPSLDYPSIDSDAFQRDVEILKHHYHNPTLNDSFLPILYLYLCEASKYSMSANQSCKYSTLTTKLSATYLRK